MKLSISPDTEFSLEAAAAFGFGPHTGRPEPGEGEMGLAFVTDDLRHHAGVLLRQEDDGTVVGEAESDAPIELVEAQVRRVLSLDAPGEPWLAVGERDPVIGRLQRKHAGLRPVLFHSPYEAAAWSIISARKHRSQASALRNRIGASHGRTFELGGEEICAFPMPEQLLALETIDGLDELRCQRLHAVARAAIDGLLEPVALREMGPEQGLAHLEQLPGIGPTYGTLILLRSTGATDIATHHEPRLASYVSHFYELGPEPASVEDLMRISDGWRPYRTWAAVLMRVAGDRAGVRFADTGPSSARARRRR